MDVSLIFAQRKKLLSGYGTALEVRKYYGWIIVTNSHDATMFYENRCIVVT